MQGQRVTNAMWNIPRNHNPPRFDPDPVAITLIDDLAMEIKQSSNPRVFPHAVLYQRLIKFAMPY